MAESFLNITIVIPTRNRQEDLQRTLAAICQQDYPIQKVIVVDASDQKIEAAFVEEHLGEQNFQLLYSEPSVCVQRNMGVKESSSAFIFLCDDDIEINEKYLFRLSEYIGSTPICDAVSGRVLEQNVEGKWIAEHPQKSKWSLLFAFIFCLSVWGSIDHISNNWWTRKLKNHYKKKGNTYTFAGWPINTNFSDPVVKTNIHGLGAALIRRSALIHSPYNEVLDPFGIGDNYGVSLGFKNQPGIHLLKDASVRHYKSNENRIPPVQAYYRRVLALDLFISTHDQFSWINRLALVWSLLGNGVWFMIKGKLPSFFANIKLILIISLGLNPYRRASRNGKKVVEPKL